MLNKAKQEAAKILENAKKTADEAIKEFNLIQIIKTSRI